MNSPYDDDTFAMRFDDAVNQMHHRRPEAPGGTILQRIEVRLSQASITGETPQCYEDISGPDTAAMDRERIREMDTTLATPISERATERSRGVSAWIAAAIVLMLVASGFYLNTLRPGDGGEQHLAWAPATPASTPVGEYACDVTPLTTDEVMAIIFNPGAGYEARGHTPINADFPDLYIESLPSDRNNWVTTSMSSVIDPEIAGEMQAFGNTFWNCLISGTSFQIWAMMDPAMLQWSILKSFPVVRSEEQLRAFVDEFGPKLYMESVNDIGAYGIFPYFIQQDPEDVARVADTAIPATRLAKSRGEGDQATSIGVITMRPIDSTDPYDYYELYVSSHPDGSWTIHWTMPNLDLPRG